VRLQNKPEQDELLSRSTQTTPWIIWKWLSLYLRKLCLFVCVCSWHVHRIT